MAQINRAWWIAGAAALVVAVVAAAGDTPQAEPEAAPEPEEPDAQERSSYGLRISHGSLEVVNWDEWMRDGPALLRVAMAEDQNAPVEVVTANVMRRVFPGEPWPPAPGDPFFGTWQEMLLVVGRAMDQPIRPYLEIVS